MAAKDTKPPAGDGKGDKPAAAAAAAADAGAGEPKLFALEKESELRFEVNARSKLIVTLDKEYTFSNAKGAIFTWQGAELSVRQPAQAAGSSAAAAAADGGGEWHGATVYVASDTPMVSYINAHAALDNLRKQAEAKKAMGPRVMIVGPGDSGKSTLTRILLSYAVRAGWKPTYVDLDVGQNGITIPGVLAASPVEHPVALEGAALYSSPPITYFFGHNTPTAGMELYQQLVERLAAAVDARAKHPDARHAGAVINTCGLVDEKGQQLLVHAATAFRVDVILVLEDERLEYQLRHEPRLKHVAVAKLAKSGGVVKRESDFRKSARDKAIAQYFYGAAAELKPHLKTVPFKDVKVYRAGGQQRATASSMLPIGAKSLLDPNALSALTATEMQSLKGRVLGVSFAKKADDLLRANCAGFVHVQAVDAKAQTITLLTPSPTPLPSQFLLTGTVTWADA